MKLSSVNAANRSLLFHLKILFLCFLLSFPAYPTENEGTIEPLKRELSEIAAGESTYVCPMHADEISHSPGSCSKCGMFLVASLEAEKQHDHSMHERDSDYSVQAIDTSMKQNSMQHMEKPMSTRGRPALYWENPGSGLNGHQQQSESAAISHDHSHAESSRTPIPTIAQTTEEQSSNNPLEKNQLTHVCPMHPQIVQDKPGNCPICGMDLVIRENSQSTGENPQVFLSAAVIQNMGVRSTKVKHEMLHKQIRTQGVVTPDDDRILTVHPRTDGWIEVLHLITEGDRVERKDVLVDFYSPWINQVQLNYITALEEYDLTSFDPSRKTELSAKVDSLQNSLRLLNVMDMDIMRIKNSRKVQNTIQLRAPQGGIVTRLNVSEGTYVEPYQSMFTIVDLSQVWVMVDIYEHQAPWVRKGQKVEISAPAIPGRNWQGVVDFIYPEVDVKTRTLRARIAVANPDEALLLNMFVQVNISNSAMQKVLTVPREAVIITGERETVIRSQGKGHFQPVEVTTGLRGENSIQILSGLNEGDEIVVSGQFLIDSESSLQASFLRMTE